jgi:hypothetical protein
MASIHGPAGPRMGAAGPMAGPAEWDAIFHGQVGQVGQVGHTAGRVMAHRRLSHFRGRAQGEIDSRGPAWRAASTGPK